MLPQKKTQKPPGAPPYKAPSGYIWSYNPNKGSMELESIIPEKPEKLSDKEQARVRLMDLADRRAREGEQFQQTPGELFGAQADSVLHGIPLASKVRAEEQKAKRQARMDEQSRLKELRTAIRAAIILRNKKVPDPFPVPGEEEDFYPPGSEDRAEIDAQIAAMKQERDELMGKKPKKQREVVAGDGTRGRPYEIQESQEQFDALPSGAWFRLPSDPPGKARQKP